MVKSEPIEGILGKGINQAQSRLMLGLSLGRARLGAGWGLSNLDDFDLSNHSLLDPKSRGAIAWLLLPLNASIYLEMSLAFTSKLGYGLIKIEQWVIKLHS